MSEFLDVFKDGRQLRAQLSDCPMKDLVKAQAIIEKVIEAQKEREEAEKQLKQEKKRKAKEIKDMLKAEGLTLDDLK